MRLLSFYKRRELERRLALWEAHRPKQLAIDFGISLSYVHVLNHQRKIRCLPQPAQSPLPVLPSTSSAMMPSSSNASTAKAGRG